VFFYLLIYSLFRRGRLIIIVPFFFLFFKGVRLLKAMGWREGQGIGPRISKIQDDDTGKTDQRLFNMS